MRVVCASCMGFCPGVRSALTIVNEINDPESTTILGPLVHNPAICDELQRRGFHLQPDTEQPPPATPAAVITAHGISDRKRAHLEATGVALVDTTCPLVRRIHDAALDFQRDGYFVVIIGHKGHAEVLGITEDLSDFVVIESPDEACTLDAKHIAVLCQSTTPTDVAIDTWHAVERLNAAAEVVFADTVCPPTRERQAAVVRLKGRVDGIVVVGGHNSNNTRQLAVLAESLGIPAVVAESAAGLPPALPARWTNVGLTAGTSTPQHLIDEVRLALEAIRPDVSEHRTGGQAA